MPTEQRYVPAVGRAWLTALYDPLTMREPVFGPALIAAVLAEPRPSVVLESRRYCCTISHPAQSSTP